MKSKGWTICSFIFEYKKVEYIVLVKRFVRPEKRKSEFALVKLHFMKSNDLNHDLQVEANINGLIIDAQALITYFGIKDGDNPGDILRQFTERLGKSIPKILPDIVSDIERKAMVNSLSRSDSEDPNKIYCSKVRRNPGNGKRSEFNSDKTKLLRKSLFKYFCSDQTISFCYSADPLMENDDATIIKNFSKQSNKKL